MAVLPSSFLHAVLILCFCVLVVNADQICAQDPPAIFPSNTGYQVRFKGGKLEVVQFLNTNSAELWENRLASLFIHKSMRDKMDLTAEQERKLELIANSHKQFHNDVLAPNSVKYGKQATDPGGKLDYKKYSELMKQNFTASQEFNKKLTKEMEEVVTPEQWRKAAEWVTKSTLRNEGVARHLVSGKFAAYMKMSPEQEQDLEKAASALVKENDAKLKKMAEETMQKMLAVLNDEQQAKLLKVLGAGNIKELESTNIIILNEQLRQFVRDSKGEGK